MNVFALLFVLAMGLMAVWAVVWFLQTVLRIVKKDPEVERIQKGLMALYPTEKIEFALKYRNFSLLLSEVVGIKQDLNILPAHTAFDDNPGGLAERLALGVLRLLAKYPKARSFLFSKKLSPKTQEYAEQLEQAMNRDPEWLTASQILGYKDSITFDKAVALLSLSELTKLAIAYFWIGVFRGWYYTHLEFKTPHQDQVTLWLQSNFIELQSELSKAMIKAVDLKQDNYTNTNFVLSKFAYPAQKMVSQFTRNYLFKNRVSDETRFKAALANWAELMQHLAEIRGIKTPAISEQDKAKLLKLWAEIRKIQASGTPEDQPPTVSSEYAFVSPALAAAAEASVDELVQLMQGQHQTTPKTTYFNFAVELHFDVAGHLIEYSVSAEPNGKQTDEVKVSASCPIQDILQERLTIAIRKHDQDAVKEALKLVYRTQTRQTIEALLPTI